MRFGKGETDRQADVTLKDETVRKYTSFIDEGR
jgi:hypothetical protein